ncbi:MAG TPA: copper chaperone PCu(A)C [Hyphomicrobiales bacterium]|nr:copper chaperone PCu(A)C [Hyphomicrobiales bacterium]
MNTKHALLALCLSSLSLAAHADIHVEDAYVRALPPGTPTTAAYMRLSNDSDAAVALVGATSPVAGKVTMHSTMNHNGMMHMMPNTKLEIPANGSLVLESGGRHLMLEELAAPLAAGTEIELTLQFDDGSATTLQVPVRSVLDE